MEFVPFSNKSPLIYFYKSSGDSQLILNIVGFFTRSFAAFSWLGKKRDVGYKLTKKVALKLYSNQRVKLVKKAPCPRPGNFCDLPVLAKSCPSALFQNVFSWIQWKRNILRCEWSCGKISWDEALAKCCPSCRTDGMHNLPVLASRFFLPGVGQADGLYFTLFYNTKHNYCGSNLKT